jgi:flagellar motility protein MotE (MotC chaperone)
MHGGNGQSFFRTALIAIALAGAGCTELAHADTIYRCRNGQGQAEFSAQPCGPDAQALDIESDPAAGVDMGAGGNFSETEKANNTRERERGIARQEQRIRALESDRDQRLAELRGRQAELGNTRASAADRRLLAAEMRAVTNDYKARLRLERDRLAHLRKQ